jgi:mRNA interferase MazF
VASVSVSRWSVWLANLDPVLGSEQGRTRPVLVISETAINDVLPVVDALPITSRKANRRIYPNEALVPAGVGGLTVDSIVLCYRIRALDKRRLVRLFVMIDDVPLKEAVLEALCFQLGITKPE